MSEQLKILERKREQIDEKIAAERRRLAEKARREAIPQRYTDEFLRWTYEGRILDEKDSPGYMGSCSFESHCAGMQANDRSHYHHSIERWVNARLNEYLDEQEAEA